MMRFEVMQQLNPALTVFSPTHTPIPSDLHNHTYKLHSIILQYNYTPTLCSLIVVNVSRLIVALFKCSS